jgi:nicotinate-nucleotide adenylyltransferase
MGADNLTNFRQWRNWREVAGAVQVAVVSRPGAGLRHCQSAPRDWIFLNARHHGQSSTALRTPSGESAAKVLA